MSRWLAASATVTAAPSIFMGVWGCATAEFPYQYRINGELYTGLHEEPFLFTDDLRRYTDRIDVGTSLRLRVDPRRPEISILETL